MAGKGDAPRKGVDYDKYRNNYDNIDWSKHKTRVDINHNIGDNNNKYKEK